MSLLFQTDSILTTLQDGGRFGYQSDGVNPGGAMDFKSLQLLNILLGNADFEAALEIHFPAPKILFEENAEIALGGADFKAQLDGVSIPNFQTHLVKAGQILSLAKKIRGNRIYLAVKGGFDVKEWLGSKSTNLKAGFGGFQGRKLQKGDRLIFATKLESIVSISRKLSPFFTDQSLYGAIRFVPGIEYDLLTPLSSELLTKKVFKLTVESDRMGFRLAGESLHLLHPKELVSSAVTFGTMQLLPDGQIIVLMADHQTTGGYPRIGTIISVDLPRIAQLGAGELVHFRAVSLETAETLALKFEQDIRFLKMGCKLS